MSAPASFFTQLNARSSAIQSLLCVGLDPHVGELAEGHKSAHGAKAFCLRLIEATHAVAAAFKPNMAFFEEWGPEGIAALEQVIAACSAKGVPVILDAKRGDISTTAAAYASAARKAGANCITVNAYMGLDTVAPFLSAGCDAFVLCKTSNPSSNELQTLQVQGGGAAAGRVFEVVAKLVEEKWGGASRLGLVVGSTDPAALAAVRTQAPSVWILAPGVGAQGGDLASALKAGLRKSDCSGMLIPVSRGISQAADPAAAAEGLRVAINAVREQMQAEAAATSTSSATSASSSKLQSYQRQFLQAAMDCNVLRFGSFTLKSGRQSPYFFNAGSFSSGKAMVSIGRAYAQAIRDSGLSFDVVFGPAYKGIPLATAVTMALAGKGDNGEPELDVPMCYNRKEAKDHGEGGTLVGASLAGKRVLLVDDVITAGTAINEAVGLVKAAGGVPVGVIIGLDRQEIPGSISPEEAAAAVAAAAAGEAGKKTTLSASQEVAASHGFPVISVVNLASLIAFVEERVGATTSSAGAGAASGCAGSAAGLLAAENLEAIKAYRSLYGAADL